MMPAYTLRLEREHDEEAMEYKISYEKETDDLSSAIATMINAATLSRPALVLADAIVSYDEIIGFNFVHRDLEQVKKAERELVDQAYRVVQLWHEHDASLAAERE